MIVTARALVRLAWRDMRGHVGRCVLILALVALPLGFITVISVALSSSTIGTEEAATFQLGDADYAVESVSGEILSPTSAGLPPGVPSVPEQLRTTTATGGDGRLAVVTVRVLDIGDPIVDGILPLRQGSPPAAAGEAALSSTFLTDLGITVGDHVHLGPADGGLDLLVTGEVTQAANVPERVVVLAKLQPGLSPGLSTQSRLYVQGTTPEQLPSGLSLVLRSDAVGWSPVGSDYMIAAAVGGLLVVQTVLLCSAAFMVGAIRRERELAVFAATCGATRSDLGRVVLVGGLLLGALGATAGIVLGTGVAAFSESSIQRLTPLLVRGVNIDFTQVAVIWLVGVGASLIAALMPAVRTRALRPLAALRRTASPAGDAAVKRSYIVASVASAAFLVGGVLAGSSVAASAGGAALLVAAPALTTPLLSRLEFVTGRARLSVRLAIQDLARHPTRSIPTLAALSTALAGAIAVSCFWATDAATRQTSYVPSVSSQHVLLRDGSLAPVPQPLVERLRSILPIQADAPVLEVGTVTPLQVNGEPIHQEQSAEEQHYVISDPRRSKIAGLYVATPALVRMLGAEDMVDEFEAGSILTWDPILARDGTTALLDLLEPGAAGAPHPAAFVTGNPPADAEPHAVMSEAEADRLGLPTTQQGWLFELDREPTSRERENAQRAVADGGILGLELLFDAEPPTAANVSVTLLLLISLALAMGVVAVATALSSADLRPDLATLTAVGASKRSRRAVMVTQAVVLSTIAGILALLIGSLLGIALARSSIPGAQLTMPWLEVLTAIVALVTLAGVVGAAMSAGNMTNARRAS